MVSSSFLLDPCPSRRKSDSPAKKAPLLASHREKAKMNRAPTGIDRRRATIDSSRAKMNRSPLVFDRSPRVID
jgi:hypothetical protein